MHKKYWLLFAILVSIAGVFSYQYFGQAIPFIKIPISMSKQEALQEATLLATKYQWDVADFEIVARYQDDYQLQAFVELEGGGKQAFIDMIEKDYYQPYLWRVRFYQEKEIKEVEIGFTPSGKPYGFMLKLPENLAGAALSKDEALKIALQGVQAWNVDVSTYELIEHHKEEMVSGRVDHEFVYQCKDLNLGQAFYRIKLKVSGDVFSSLQHLVKIPDEFVRRYSQMRSTNNMFAGLARNLGFLLYLCVFGLFSFVFFFHRKHGLLFKKVFALMVIFATLILLNAVNTWPLIWYEYPTHVTSTMFILSKLIEILLGTLFITLLVGVVVLLAEAAARFVFPNHIQFFRLWSFDVLTSYQVLEQTLLGYGCAVIMLADTVAFYVLAQKLGWWSPLNTIFDPNILSTRLPFFAPVVMSFQAGFLEEFLFRALPLAGVLLVAKNSRYKKSWLFAMFVVQILIFGACHANYPQQPAYYRIVELISISTVLGVLYCWFGLLPGIVAHFSYDAMLFCLPIFVSGLVVQQVMAIISIAIPLLVIFAAWICRSRRLHHAPADCYNKASDIGPDEQGSIDVQRLVGSAISNKARVIALIGGVVGLMLWSVSKDFDFNTSPIAVTVAQAESIALKTVVKEVGLLDNSWHLVYCNVNPKCGMGEKYIWQTFGNDVYQILQGSYVASPGYKFKWVKYKGLVEERSEFFQVIVQADGSVAQYHHAFPEFLAGADLTEREVLPIAYQAIERFYHVTQEDLQSVSVTSQKHAQRRDWTVIFKDNKNYNVPTGQARIIVEIAGDKLSCISRCVYPPEQWVRAEKSRMTQDGLVKFATKVIICLWSLFFILMAIFKFGVSVRYFRPFLLLTSMFALLQFVVVANNWREVMYAFNNSEPIINQMISLIGYNLITSLVMGATWALLLMSAFYCTVRAHYKNIVKAVPLGVALGCILVGFTSIFKHFETTFSANHPCYGFSTHVIPTLDIFLSYFVLIIMTDLVMLISLFGCIQGIVKKTGCFWLQPVLFMFSGLILSNCTGLDNAQLWIISGLLIGVLWYLIYRFFLQHDGDLLWIMLATFQILQLLPSAWYGAYPGVWIQVLISSCMIFGVVTYLYRKI